MSVGLPFGDEMFPSRMDLFLAGSGPPGPGPMGTRSRNLPDAATATGIPCSWQEATHEDVVDGQAAGVFVSHLIYARVSDLIAALGLGPSGRVNEAIPEGSRVVIDGETLFVQRCRDEGGTGQLARIACRERS